MKNESFAAVRETRLYAAIVRPSPYLRHFCCSLQPFCTLNMIDVCCYALLTSLTRVKESFLYMYPLWFLCEYGFILAATAAGNPAQILNIAENRLQFLLNVFESC